MSNSTTRQVMAFYRLSHAIDGRGWPRLARAVAALGRSVTSAEVHPTARLHRTVGFAHAQGVVIGPLAVLGEGTVLFQGVTIGWKDHGVPTLGRFVTVYPGAKIIGGIQVGDEVSVGANAVVLHDVAPGDVVAGVPARRLHDGAAGS